MTRETYRFARLSDKYSLTKNHLKVNCQTINNYKTTATQIVAVGTL
jgi:hypothetical protein